jgi:hypothetical protein
MLESLVEELPHLLPVDIEVLVGSRFLRRTETALSPL